MIPDLRRLPAPAQHRETAGRNEICQERGRHALVLAGSVNIKSPSGLRLRKCRQKTKTLTTPIVPPGRVVGSFTAPVGLIALAGNFAGLQQ